jgi:hypothetical protein
MSSLTDQISDVYTYHFVIGGSLNTEIYTFNEISDEDIWALAHQMDVSGPSVINVWKRSPAFMVSEP